MSINTRSGSVGDVKTTFAPKPNPLKDRLNKPIEPFVDNGDGSTVNSPIFGRKNMEEYFHDLEKNTDTEEENEYSDPSGVWMGPPDKREPKISQSFWEPMGSPTCGPVIGSPQAEGSAPLQPLADVPILAISKPTSAKE